MGLVTLVRHGQASFGSDNYDKLSDIGEQQALWLGEYFSQHQRQFDHIVCGTLTRHKQTTNGILTSHPHAVETVFDDRVNEFAFMQIVAGYIDKYPASKPAANAPRSDYYRLLKKAMFAWQDKALDQQNIPETWLAFRQRTHSFIQDIFESTHKNVLVVSSGGAISLMLQFVLNAPEKTAVELNLQMRNGCISECFFGAGKGYLSSFNDVGYMQTPQRKHAITYS